MVETASNIKINTLVLRLFNELLFCHLRAVVQCFRRVDFLGDSPRGSCWCASGELMDLPLCKRSALSEHCLPGCFGCVGVAFQHRQSTTECT